MQRLPLPTSQSLPEIALTVGIFAALALGFLEQRAIEALLGLALETAQAGQRLVEVAPLRATTPRIRLDDTMPLSSRRTAR